jgi:hypothetical protein
MLRSLRTPIRLLQRRAAFVIVASLTLSVVAVSIGEVPSVAAACKVLATIEPNTHNVGAPCLEKRLMALGYTSVTKADLFYDTVSVRAVQRFQTLRGLFPDGLVTSITSRELGLRGPLPAAPGTARLTIIGDSTSAAMRWYDEANNRTAIYDVMGNTYDLVWSLESCRRLVATSCVGRVDPGNGGQWRPVSVLPLMRGSLKGKLGAALVIMAGYDDVDIGTAIDQVMGEALAQGVPTVYWLTYRSSTTYGYASYYRQHNAQLAAATAKYANLVVLDWNTYSRSLPAATQKLWFAADNIHMSRVGGLGLATWLRQRIAPKHIEHCVAANAAAGIAGAGVGSPTIVATEHTGFEAVAPTRLIDTRSPTLGGGHGALGAGRMLTLDLTSLLPPGGRSAVVNVTAVNPCQSGTITVFACGPRPAIGTVAVAVARTTGSLAISPLANGKVCVHTSVTTDLVVDLEGAFVPGGALFHPLTPVRFFTSRTGLAVTHVAGPLAAPRDITVKVAGVGGVPLDATAAWFNMAAINATSDGVLALWPGACGAPAATSNLNVLRQRTTGNGVVVGLGGNGSVCVRIGAGTVDVALDLAGWFGGPSVGGLEFRQSTPIGMVGNTAPKLIAAATPLEVTTNGVGVYSVMTINSAHVGTVSARPCGTATAAYLLTARPVERLSNLSALAPASGGWCIASTTATGIAVALLGSFTTPPA